VNQVPTLLRDGARVALLTPYTGNNFGDAAIQDAFIVNLGRRLRGAQFSGITLNCENFVQRHGVRAYPLCASNRPFYGMMHPSSVVAKASKSWEGRATKSRKRPATVLMLPLRKAYAFFATLRNEIGHAYHGYRFLRAHDLLIVSGGGQLDEEWGGTYGHPYALAKWALLSYMARIPFAVASVGACKSSSSTTKLFLSLALAVASYRSYRDQGTKEIACTLLGRARGDSVVPDAAFGAHSLHGQVSPSSNAPGTVALSLISYCKPGHWPNEEEETYRRYLREMAGVVSSLLERGTQFVIVWSAVEDKIVLEDLLSLLGRDDLDRLSRQSTVPQIRGWQELFGVLSGCRFLIASRLHNIILGFAARKPVIAISFDRKVDQVMEDLGQDDFLLQIRTFACGEVISKVDKVFLSEKRIVGDLNLSQRQMEDAFDKQYDVLASLARRRYRRDGNHGFSHGAGTGT
jgi:polysaccharide pyruvyl transferase WcaK-like protein